MKRLVFLCGIASLLPVVCSCTTSECGGLGVALGLPCESHNKLELISNKENTVFEIRMLGETEKRMVGKGKFVSAPIGDPTKHYEVFATPEGFVTKSITTPVPPTRSVQFVFEISDGEGRTVLKTWEEVAQSVVKGLDPPLGARVDKKTYFLAVSAIYNSEGIPIRMTDELRGYLETQMGKSGYHMIERGEALTAKLMDELAQQHSARYDDDAAARVGKLLGAKGLIFGKVTNEYERQIGLQVKVTSVETGEIMGSVSVAIQNDPTLIRDGLQTIRKRE